MLRTRIGLSTSTTRSRTDFLLSSLLAGLALAAWPAVATQTIVLPIVGDAHGVNDAWWNVEVRAINRSDVTKHLAVVDWIGTPNWKPTSYDVPPHSTLSVGGWPFAGGGTEALAGTAICSVDEGLIVEAAVLTGHWGGAGVRPCWSYEGGYVLCVGPVGAGPIIEGLAFTPANQETFLPWLHTVFTHRTNLSLTNPDVMPAHVTVAITSEDGTVSQSADYDVPAHGIIQINDLFSMEPWTAIRTANTFANAGATAIIKSDTRLLALAYVISNENNSLTISVPH